MLVTFPSSTHSNYSLHLHLLSLLLKCAQLISAGNLTDAGDLLPEIFELSSPFNSPASRVAAYFATSLQSHLLLNFLSPPLHHQLPSSLTLISSQLNNFHSSLQSYNSLTPFVKFSHFTANQAIFDALNGYDRVHVIDLDIMQGLQWPGFFHILASRTRKLTSVKLTGFGPSSESLARTGARLAEFADSVGVPFRFIPVQGQIGNLSASELSRLSVEPSDEEVTVVHCVHHGLYDISGSHLGTMRVLNRIRPKLVTMVEQDIHVCQCHGSNNNNNNDNTNTTSFFERFVGALRYYSALFDAVGEGLDEDSVERHQVEHYIFGCEIRNILAVGGGGGGGGGDHGVRRWGEELILAGFEPLSLAGSPAAQASLLLGMFPWKGYTLMEENGCLRLGWKDLPLITASAWQLTDFSITNNGITKNSNVLRN